MHVIKPAMTMKFVFVSYLFGQIITFNLVDLISSY